MRLHGIIFSVLLVAPLAAQELPQGSGLDTWGAGRMHATGGFSYTSTDSFGASVDTLALSAEYGYLVDEHWEVNGRLSWMDQDMGILGDASFYAFQAGGRYYVLAPKANRPYAVFGGARLGIVNQDLGPGFSSTDPSLGIDGGVIWWPWGYGRGMALDLRLDYFTSSELDVFGVLAGISFWW